MTKVVDEATFPVRYHHPLASNHTCTGARRRERPRSPARTHRPVQLLKCSSCVRCCVHAQLYASKIIAPMFTSLLQIEACPVRRRRRARASDCDPTRAAQRPPAALFKSLPVPCSCVRAQLMHCVGESIAPALVSIAR